MTTRTDVKINNDYDYVRDVDPTTSENTVGGFFGGQRWLNTTTGDSFFLTDPDSGTWAQIEESDDARIDRMLKPREYGFFKLTGYYFYRFRQTRLEITGGPGSIDRGDLEVLGRYQSLYAEWTMTKGAGETVIQSADIVGDITELAVGDYIQVRGSQRSDGLYAITAVGADQITVDQEIEDDTDLFIIILLSPVSDFCQIVGRMMWFDIYIRNKRSGLSSERIGTYSYTMGPIIGGVGYPVDVAGAFEQYVSAAVGGYADYVN